MCVQVRMEASSWPPALLLARKHWRAADPHATALCKEKVGARARAGTLCFAPLVIGMHMLRHAVLKHGGSHF